MLLVYVVRCANTWRMPRCMTVFRSTLGTMPPLQTASLLLSFARMLFKIPMKLEQHESLPYSARDKALTDITFCFDARNKSNSKGA